MPSSLQQQLAQLLMIGFQGPEPDEDTWRFLQETPPAAILLFKHNITSQAQISGLIGRIQDCCRRSGSHPLLVAVDQEGGRVARLGSEVGFPVVPSAAVLAQSPEPEKAVTEAAGAIAAGLRSLGINMNLAPVLDVVTDPDNRVIGDRAYGKDADVVGRLGCAAIAAIQSQRVAAVAKHFPGHGPTSVDSHLDLPVIPVTRAELESVHLAPFRKAIGAGVSAIMTAHAIYPALDPLSPATLSRSILTDLLGEALHYEGVIVTDSLTMQAIARHQSAPEACVRAFEAGADLLMIPTSPPVYRGCLDALVAVVEDNPVAQVMLTKSRRVIDDLREKYG